MIKKNYILIIPSRMFTLKTYTHKKIITKVKVAIHNNEIENLLVNYYFLYNIFNIWSNFCKIKYKKTIF